MDYIWSKQEIYLRRSNSNVSTACGGVVKNKEAFTHTATTLYSDVHNRNSLHN